MSRMSRAQDQRIYQIGNVRVSAGTFRFDDLIHCPIEDKAGQWLFTGGEPPPARELIEGVDFEVIS